MNAFDCIFIVSIALISLLYADINDFRLGIQLCGDEAGKKTGSEQYTLYIQDGGGWSLWAGDNDYFDPDGARIGIFG